MGLKIKILSKTELNRMSTIAQKLAAAAAAAKAAAAASAASAVPQDAPKAAPKATKQCNEFLEKGRPCHRKYCWDISCRNAKKASVSVVSSNPSAPAKSAGGGDGGFSAQFSALEAKLVDHIDQRFEAVEESMKSGFLQQEQSLLGLNQAVAQSQIETQRSIQALANVMAAAISGGQRQLPPTERRQIGYIPASEVAVEPQRQISFGQNAGWDPAAERPGFGLQPTSRASSAITYGVATEFVRNQEASTFFRESSGGSSIGDARQLGVSHSLPNFEEAARRWNTRRDKNNEKILHAIRQMAGCNDNMACLLLALVNGKTFSEIVKMYNTEVGQLLSTHNTTFFQSFFTALTRCGLPEKFDVKVDSSKTRSGNAFLMTYLQLSQSPSNVDKLVTFLRGE